MSDTATSHTEAPDHAVSRHCALVREGGQPCRGIPAIGETFCHAHRRYRASASRISIAVPLLEDEESILFVISQTVRSMSLGSIPPANGQAMLTGCRLALRVLEHRLAAHKLALRSPADPRNPTPPTPDSTPATESSPVADDAIRDDAPTLPESTSSESTSSPNTFAALEPPVAEEEDEPRPLESHFPGVRRQWDRAQARVAAEIARMVSPHENETWQDAIRRAEILKQEAGA